MHIKSYHKAADFSIPYMKINTKMAGDLVVSPPLVKALSWDLGNAIPLPADHHGRIPIAPQCLLHVHRIIHI